MNNEIKNSTAGKKQSVNKKYLKIGSFSMVMCLIVIAVVIAVNLFVSELPTTLTKYDMSALDLFSISEETEQVLAGVDTDVTFYILTQRGGEDKNIAELLGRYTALNPHIKVKTVDPIENPAFIEQYTTSQLNDNSVIAESALRSYVLDYYEIYTQTIDTSYTEQELMQYYYTYYTFPTVTSFAGELAFTTAVDYVTRSDLPTVYSLTGHGETALSATYSSYINAENIAESTMTLLNIDAIPENCTTILINNPTSDISADECRMLTAYLNEGGNIILLTSATGFSSNLMPNLTALAAHMGLAPVDGIVIETSRNNYMSYPHFLLPNLGSAAAEPLSLLSNSQIYVLANAAHGIIADGTTNVTPLLSTTNAAYVKANLNAESLEKADGDYEGMVYIGAAVTGEGSGVRSDSCKFVWFSSPALTDEAADQYVSGGNSAVFMASLNWMSENKINLSIMAKALQVEALTVPAAQAGIWSVVVVFVIPLAFLALGFAVWFRRRKK